MNITGLENTLSLSTEVGLTERSALYRSLRFGLPFAVDSKHIKSLLPDQLKAF